MAIRRWPCSSEAGCASAAAVTADSPGVVTSSRYPLRGGLGVLALPQVDHGGDDGDEDDRRDQVIRHACECYASWVSGSCSQVSRSFPVRSFYKASFAAMASI